MYDVCVHVCVCGCVWVWVCQQSRVFNKMNYSRNSRMHKITIMHFYASGELRAHCCRVLRCLEMNNFRLQTVFFVNALVTLIPRSQCAHAHCIDDNIWRRVNDGYENGIYSIYNQRWLTDFSENA